MSAGHTRVFCMGKVGPLEHNKGNGSLVVGTCTGSSLVVSGSMAGLLHVGIQDLQSSYWSGQAGGEKNIAVVLGKSKGVAILLGLTDTAVA